jgi:rod shape determining protein RodA
MRLDQPYREHISLVARLGQINWGVVTIICVISAIGFAMLYSAAGGDLDPWATRQMSRFAVGLVVMFGVALTDLRFWLRYAYGIFLVALALLLAVDLIGSGAMGAQRWVNFGYFRVQPSEFMKIAMVLALARYFHRITMENMARPVQLLVPLGIVLVPALLVLKQPDLGTAVMITVVGAAMFYLAGVRIWKFAVVGVASLAAVPIVWRSLHSYQQERILTYLDPERDPLGAGYHILQSKIALGAGGIWGKGFLQGSQSHLNFLPEKQTDFIFTMLAEEFGIVGGLTLILLYGMLLAYGIAMSLRCRNQFGRLVAMGVTTTFFLYIFINVAMVMGLIPVVGVPLPLISYGGTAMMTLMFGFGLLLCVHVHRDARISRYDTTD